MNTRLKDSFLSEIEKLKTTIQRKQTYLKSDSIIIFTCGAQPNDKIRVGRSTFLKYAENHLPEYNFFMAEDFFDTYSGSGLDRSNLLSLEERMAQYSDCIILILESESTFAELGAFALSESISKLCLVINEIEFIDSPSFINQGPIKKINNDSIFKPSINVKLENISTVFNEIEDRLKVIKRRKNRSINLSAYDNFLESNSKHRLLLILDIISLLSPLKYSELITVLESIYGKHDFKILFEKALLKAIDMIEIKDDYLFKTVNEMKLFYEFKNLNTLKLRSSIINLYHKYSRDRLSYLASR